MPENYNFKRDSKDIWDLKVREHCTGGREIDFLVVLFEGINPNEARRGLEKLTERIYVHFHNRSTNALECITDAQKYQSLFNDSLEKHADQECRKGYTTNGYKETKPAIIPELINKYVNEIKLDINDSDLAFL
mgnify:FL=1